VGVPREFLTKIVHGGCFFDENAWFSSFFDEAVKNAIKQLYVC
jgi:hypothetical protein